MRIFGEWYLIRDSGRPSDYPPRAREELVGSRLRIDDLKRAQNYQRLLDRQARAITAKNVELGLTETDEMTAS